MREQGGRGEEMDVAAKWGARKEAEDGSRRHRNTGRDGKARERAVRTAGTRRDVGHGRQQGRTRRREDEILSWETRRRGRGLWVKGEPLPLAALRCSRQAFCQPLTLYTTVQSNAYFFYTYIPCK